MKTFVGVLAVLLMAGCAPAWYHVGMRTNELTRADTPEAVRSADSAACQSDALAYGLLTGTWPLPMGPHWAICMSQKGYAP